MSTAKSFRSAQQAYSVGATPWVLGVLDYLQKTRQVWGVPHVIPETDTAASATALKDSRDFHVFTRVLVRVPGSPQNLSRKMAPAAVATERHICRCLSKS
jgi:hypothetical protein